MPPRYILANRFRRWQMKSWTMRVELPEMSSDQIPLEIFDTMEGEQGF
jgi:hypothetical protein